MTVAELRRGHEHLLKVVLRLRPARVFAVLEDNRAGYPTNSEGDPVTGGDRASITERFALNRDQARDAQHRYRRALHRAVAAVDELAALERFWCFEDAPEAGRFGTAPCCNIHCREPVPLTAKQVTDAEPVRCHRCHSYWTSTGRDADGDAIRKRKERRAAENE